MAALTEQRRFGSFDLTHGTNGITVETWRDRILHETRFSPSPKGRGSLLESDRYVGREIQLDGKLVGTDTGDFRDKLDTLLKNLSNGEQYLTLFSTRRILCRLQGDIQLEPDGPGLNSYTWSARFRSRWHTWEKTTSNSTPVSHSGTSSTGTLAANNGTAAAYPTVTVTNNGTGFTGEQVTITNTSTMGQIALQGLALNAGQSVIIDHREARIGDGISIPQYPSVVDGEFWEISANSTQGVSITTTGSRTLGVTFLWFEQYWAC